MMDNFFLLLAASSLLFGGLAIFALICDVPIKRARDRKAKAELDRFLLQRDIERVKRGQHMGEL